MTLPAHRSGVLLVAMDSATPSVLVSLQVVAGPLWVSLVAMVAIQPEHDLRG